MVGCFHADTDVDSLYLADPDHSTSGRSDHGSRNDSYQYVHHYPGTIHHYGICSATHDIAADGFYMLALKSGEQAEFVGIRSTFYRLASIFGQGVLVAIAGAIELKYDNIPLSWTITMLVTAVMFSAVSFYHLFAIPKPASDKSVLAPGTASAKAIFKEFGRTFATYFTKPGVLLAIVFMLLYRLPEHSSSRCACLSLLPPKEWEA